MDMSVVEDLAQKVPLPRMVRIEQHFDRTAIADIEGGVRSAISDRNVLDSIRPGMSVAVTAGSRGISNIALILRTIVRILKEKGAEPFVIPAMGSHGGATAQGQLEVLASLGITEGYLSCPIRSSMEVRKIGATFDGHPVQIDALAAQADGIIVVNRIKAHTSFTGSVESGLMKMMAIGLAKQAGAEVCHQEGYAKIAENIRKYGSAILKNARILFGVAMIENAFDDTCEIHAVRPEDFEKENRAYCFGRKNGCLVSCFPTWMFWWWTGWGKISADLAWIRTLPAVLPVPMPAVRPDRTSWWCWI